MNRVLFVGGGDKSSSTLSLSSSVVGPPSTVQPTDVVCQPAVGHVQGPRAAADAGRGQANEAFDADELGGDGGIIECGRNTSPNDSGRRSSPSDTATGSGSLFEQVRQMILREEDGQNAVLPGETMEKTVEHVEQVRQKFVREYSRI